MKEKRREDDDETTEKTGDIDAYRASRLIDVDMIRQSTRLGTTLVTVNCEHRVLMGDHSWSIY